MTSGPVERVTVWPLSRTAVTRCTGMVASTSIAAPARAATRSCSRVGEVTAMGEHYDVALRDFGLLVAAVALAALAFDRRPA